MYLVLSRTCTDSYVVAVVDLSGNASLCWEQIGVVFRKVREGLEKKWKIPLFGLDPSPLRSGKNEVFF